MAKPLHQLVSISPAGLLGTHPTGLLWQPPSCAWPALPLRSILRITSQVNSLACAAPSKRVAWGHYCPWAAVTKGHTLGGLYNRNVLVPFAAWRESLPCFSSHFWQPQLLLACGWLSFLRFKLSPFYVSVSGSKYPLW